MRPGGKAALAIGVGIAVLVVDQWRRTPDDRGVVGPLRWSLGPRGGDGRWQADLFRREDGSRYLDLEAPDGRYLVVNLTPSAIRRARRRGETWQPPADGS